MGEESVTRYLARQLVTPDARTYQWPDPPTTHQLTRQRSVDPPTSPLTAHPVGERPATVNASRASDIDLSQPIVAHAWDQIAQSLLLTGQHRIDRFTRDEILRFLTRISDDETVYPVIAADGDGTAIAQWNAGETSIVIQFDYTGPLLIRAKVGRDTHISEEAAEIQSIAINALRSLSQEVNAANPRWRSLFL